MEEQQHRRAADDQLREVIRQMHDDRVEARQFRMNAARDIKCLADGFKSHADLDAKWKSRFEPLLQDALTRRNWWEKFWEERRVELITYGIKGSFLTFVGLVIYALAGKATEFIRKAVSLI